MICGQVSTGQWNVRSTGKEYPCQAVLMKGSVCPIPLLFSLLRAEMQTTVGHLAQVDQASGFAIVEQKDRGSLGP